jgi:glycosyltransferase involved in cell wall biosynthesis
MSRKPRILFCADVIGWAWDQKSRVLQKYLSDEFDISITYLHEPNNAGIDVAFYDLYFLYGWNNVERLFKIPKERKIAGVTAHKPEITMKSYIVPQLKCVMWHHANSVLLLEELRKWELENVFYVPNGVEEELFNIKVPIPEKRNNLVIGHVGKASGNKLDAKGHARFIEPACKIANVIYIGHYNNYRNRIPHEKMPDFYQQIDAFIVSSETDGTPNGALEAAACGRPILSNRIGNMPELIKDGYNGFLIERNVDAYVEKLLYLKNNREHLREMGKNARKTIEENWTWKIMAENYRNMFRSILDKIGIR